MCHPCHEQHSSLPVHAVAAAIAFDHGDNNATCVREIPASPQDLVTFAGSSYLSDNGTIYGCVDCGDMVRAMDSDDHCCYSDG